MTPERWHQIKKILSQVLALDPAKRLEEVEKLCAGDQALRSEVEHYLQFASEAGDDSDEPSGTEPTRTDPNLGRHVGPYRLIQLLGEGGMGAVYLAERQDLPKRVAVKLIRSGFASFAKITQRFHHEEQILARLEHPNIAQLLDAGTTDDGLPYFVMEHVEGESLGRYCASRRLSIGGRLELFLKVCSAVQFAHKNMVVHRDLKPGNVLVTADGVPKLLDFGISKLLDADPAARLTTEGLGPMTVAYASPEQVRAEPISTASDVYSLGVVLYELLTGQPPYPEGSNIVEAICEKEPTRPSTAVLQRPETGGFPDDLQRLKRRLAGDLDCIVLEAMHKDPDERYSSVEKFADDIRRHLAGLPVEAREGNFAYRAGKFARRNRLTLMSVAILMLMIFSASGAFVLWRENQQQRQQAEFQARQAEVVSQLLMDLFRAIYPNQTRETPPDLFAILEQGQERIESLVEEPALRINLLGTLGEIYLKLGRYPESRELMERTRQLARQQFPGDHPLVARSLANLAAFLYDRGDAKEAVPLLLEARAMLIRLGQPDDALTVASNLAATYMLLDKLEEAETLYLEILEARVARFGHDHPRVATVQRSLGAVYFLRGEPAEAEPRLRDALRIRRAELGNEHTGVAGVLGLLGRVMATLDREEEAVALLREAFETQLRLFGEHHAKVALTKSWLAAVRLRDDPELARSLATEALADLSRKKAGSWQVAEAESVLGACLSVLGRYAEAEAHLLAGHTKLRKIRGERIVYTQNARHWLVDLYEAWNKPEKAAEYRVGLKGWAAP